MSLRDTFRKQNKNKKNDLIILILYDQTGIKLEINIKGNGRKQKDVLRVRACF